MKLSIKDIVKGNTALFSHYRNGKMHYDIVNKENGILYSFNIDIEDKKDIAGATLAAEYKAITLMRYIRKCIDRNEFISYI